MVNKLFKRRASSTRQHSTPVKKSLVAGQDNAALYDEVAQRKATIEATLATLDTRLDVLTRGHYDGST